MENEGLSVLPDSPSGTLRTALAGKTVSIIACPVDCSEKIKLTDKLGECEFVVDPA